MKTGLSETSSVGRCGSYREWADHANVMQLATCVARDVDFHMVRNERITFLGGPVLPRSHSRQHLGSSWTGAAYRYQWEGGGFDVYLKTTLPGPLFVPAGRELHWRWAVSSGVPSARCLPDGEEFRCAEAKENLGQVVLLKNWSVPTLLVSSSPILRMSWVSHEGMTLEFANSRANVLIVPLLDIADAPSDVAPWLDLIAAPPTACREEFEVRGDRVAIRQSFTSYDGEACRVVPLPPVAGFSPLQSQPQSRLLAQGLMGRFRVVDGSQWESEIQMDWALGKPAPTRHVDAQGLSPIPEELAYAGDVTWEPGSAMDQLLALRVWAPLAAVCPPSIWSTIRPQLAPPSAQRLKESLAVFAEPVSGLQWAKEAKLFEEAGDVSYDSDWYNGFELSGLWRAAQCADAAISEPARLLARGAKAERQLLTNYFSIFHDWELGAAWTCPRGCGWNTDCSHNGMEGLLAQAALCREEGDAEGAEFAFYLAAKTASALMAAEWLVDYQIGIGFALDGGGACNLLPEAQGGSAASETSQEKQRTTFGMSGIYTARGADAQTAASRNPYALAGNFPEFCLLQRKYGRMERYREIVAEWERKHAARYEDWHAFYIAGNPYPQEARIQASVMYHLAPDIAFRLWTLDQPGEAVERLFKTPLNLVEQLWCRSKL